MPILDLFRKDYFKDRFRRLPKSASPRLGDSYPTSLAQRQYNQYQDTVGETLVDPSSVDLRPTSRWTAVSSLSLARRKEDKSSKRDQLVHDNDATVHLLQADVQTADVPASDRQITEYRTEEGRQQVDLHGYEDGQKETGDGLGNDSNASAVKLIDRDDIIVTNTILITESPTMLVSSDGDVSQPLSLTDPTSTASSDIRSGPTAHQRNRSKSSPSSPSKTEQMETDVAVRNHYTMDDQQLTVSQSLHVPSQSQTDNRLWAENSLLQNDDQNLSQPQSSQTQSQTRQTKTQSRSQGQSRGQVSSQGETCQGQSQSLTQQQQRRSQELGPNQKRSRSRSRGRMKKIGRSQDPSGSPGLFGSGPAGNDFAGGDDSEMGPSNPVDSTGSGNTTPKFGSSLSWTLAHLRAKTRNVSLPLTFDRRNQSGRRREEENTVSLEDGDTDRNKDPATSADGDGDGDDGGDDVTAFMTVSGKRKGSSTISQRTKMLLPWTSSSSRSTSSSPTISSHPSPQIYQPRILRNQSLFSQQQRLPDLYSQQQQRQQQQRATPKQQTQKQFGSRGKAQSIPDVPSLPPKPLLEKMVAESEKLVVNKVRQRERNPSKEDLSYENLYQKSMSQESLDNQLLGLGEALKTLEKPPSIRSTELSDMEADNAHPRTDQVMNTHPGTYLRPDDLGPSSPNPLTAYQLSQASVPREPEKSASQPVKVHEVHLAGTHESDREVAEKNLSQRPFPPRSSSYANVSSTNQTGEDSENDEHGPMTFSVQPGIIHRLHPRFRRGGSGSTRSTAKKTLRFPSPPSRSKSSLALSTVGEDDGEKSTRPSTRSPSPSSNPASPISSSSFSPSPSQYPSPSSSPRRFDKGRGEDCRSITSPELGFPTSPKRQQPQPQSPNLRNDRRGGRLLRDPLFPGKMLQDLREPDCQATEPYDFLTIHPRQNHSKNSSSPSSFAPSSPTMSTSTRSLLLLSPALPSYNPSSEGTVNLPTSQPSQANSLTPESPSSQFPSLQSPSSLPWRLPSTAVGDPTCPSLHRRFQLLPPISTSIDFGRLAFPFGQEAVEAGAEAEVEAETVEAVDSHYIHCLSRASDSNGSQHKQKDKIEHIDQDDSGKVDSGVDDEYCWSAKTLKSQDSDATPRACSPMAHPSYDHQIRGDHQPVFPEAHPYRGDLVPTTTATSRVSTVAPRSVLESTIGERASHTSTGVDISLPNWQLSSSSPTPSLTSNRLSFSDYFHLTTTPLTSPIAISPLTTPTSLTFPSSTSPSPTKMGDSREVYNAKRFGHAYPERNYEPFIPASSSSASASTSSSASALASANTTTTTTPASAAASASRSASSSTPASISTSHQASMMYNDITLIINAYGTSTPSSPSTSSSLTHQGVSLVGGDSSAPRSGLTEHGSKQQQGSEGKEICVPTSAVGRRPKQGLPFRISEESTLSRDGEERDRKIGSVSQMDQRKDNSSQEDGRTSSVAAEGNSDSESDDSLDRAPRRPTYSLHPSIQPQPSISLLAPVFEGQIQKRRRSQQMQQILLQQQQRKEEQEEQHSIHHHHHHLLPLHHTHHHNHHLPNILKLKRHRERSLTTDNVPSPRSAKPMPIRTVSESILSFRMASTPSPSLSVSMSVSPSPSPSPHSPAHSRVQGLFGKAGDVGKSGLMARGDPSSVRSTSVSQAEDSDHVGLGDHHQGESEGDTYTIGRSLSQADSGVPIPATVPVPVPIPMPVLKRNRSIKERAEWLVKKIWREDGTGDGPSREEVMRLGSRGGEATEDRVIQAYYP